LTGGLIVVLAFHTDAAAGTNQVKPLFAYARFSEGLVDEIGRAGLTEGVCQDVAFNARAAFCGFIIVLISQTYGLTYLLSLIIDCAFLALPAFARNIEVPLHADAFALAVDLPVSCTAFLYAIFPNEVFVFLAGVIADGDVAVFGARCAAVA
jgi:hypothetical protein